jgi:hypothetical protein
MRNHLKTSIAALATAMLAAFPATAATVTIGGPGNGDLVNVGGTNTDPNVSVLTNNTAAPTGTVTTNALGGAGQTNGSVLLDLFGQPDGAYAVANFGTTGAGNTNGEGASIDLFGDDSTGSGGTAGATGGGTENNQSGLPTQRLSQAGGKCFTPTTAQLAKLTSRHTYTTQTASSWMTATKLKIVSVGLCDRATVVAAKGIGNLQMLAASNPMITETL